MPAKNPSQLSKLSGPTTEFVISIVQQVGVPTAFLFALLYLVGWKLGPPVIDGHVQFLEKTTETLVVMAETLKKTNEAIDTLNRSVNEIIVAERNTSGFMQRVDEAHEDHATKLDVACQKASVTSTKVDEILTHVTKEK